MRTFCIPSRRQLWRHDCNYDVMHFFQSLTSNFSGTERDTDVFLYCWKLLDQGYHMAFYFNKCPTHFFPKISRQVVRRWKRLDKQRSDDFSEWKFLINFLRYRRKCAKKIMAIRRQLWRHDCNYDVMNFFESLTSNISGTERDTDVILSLLESTRSSLSYGVLFQQCPKQSIISRKVVRCWKRLDQQKSDHFSESKYLINFLRYSRKCAEKLYREQASIMTSWLQLWHNDFFGIFDVEYLRNRGWYRRNSFTAGIYSIMAIYINMCLQKNSKISRKVVDRWKQLDE